VATLGDKWSLIILDGILLNNKQHFNEFLNTPDKISTNLLGNALQMTKMKSLFFSKYYPIGQTFENIFNNTKGA